MDPGGSFTTCYNCEQGTIGFDNTILNRVYAGSLYIIGQGYREHEFSKEIWNAKKSIDMARLLSEHIINIYPRHEELSKVDYIVPIPKNTQERPFDQAMEIALQYSRKCSGEFKPILTPLDNVEPRHTYKKTEKNDVVNRYESSHSFEKNDMILIVDDTLNEGKTIGSASSVIYNAGGRNIYGLVVARGIDKKHLDYVGLTLEEI